MAGACRSPRSVSLTVSSPASLAVFSGPCFHAPEPISAARFFRLFALGACLGEMVRDAGFEPASNP